MMSLPDNQVPFPIHPFSLCSIILTIFWLLQHTLQAKVCWTFEHLHVSPSGYILAPRSLMTQSPGEFTGLEDLLPMSLTSMAAYLVLAISSLQWPLNSDASVFSKHGGQFLPEWTIQGKSHTEAMPFMM